jgi:hypothetical protein
MADRSTVRRPSKALVHRFALGGQQPVFRCGHLRARPAGSALLPSAAGRRSTSASRATISAAAASAPPRVDEEDPEAVVDDVQRRLAAAHRALDEVHDEELRFVQQEAVARSPAESRRRW